jgi:hypothetical protein
MQMRVSKIHDGVSHAYYEHQFNESPHKDDRLPVSHIAVSPPFWLQRSFDPDSVIFVPERCFDAITREYCFRANDQDIFHCVNGHWATFVASQAPTIIKAKVFMLEQAIELIIPVIPCRKCAKGGHSTQYYCGPDLGNIGLFNYNNYSLFSHTLMNDYLSRLCQSGETMSAFTIHISRLYDVHKSRIPFPSRKTFIKVSNLFIGLFYSTYFGFRHGLVILP